MRVDRIRVEPSPEGDGRVRLLADVRYDTAPSAQETFWFEVPASHAKDLSTSGNPWIAAMLPLAATLGEEPEVAAPVDARLLRGASEILRIWSDWYAFTGEVPLSAEVERGARPGNRTAAFFSGGVDSFHTALTRRPLDELIFLGGFDLSLDATEATAAVRHSLETAASKMGMPLVFVRTNWRETRAREVDWELVGHGALLAAVGLALEPRYGQVLIPTSGWTGDVWPWGSDHRTDPLLSTRGLCIAHHGRRLDKHERAATVAASEVGRAHLRVCWSSADGSNCGRCEKCRLTMLMMEVLAGLDRCPTLPNALPPSDVRRMRIDTTWDARRLQACRDRAEPELARAIDTALRRSTRASRWRCLLARRRGLGALLRPVRRLLESGFLPAPDTWPSRLEGTAYPGGRGHPRHGRASFRRRGPGSSRPRSP